MQPVISSVRGLKNLKEYMFLSSIQSNDASNYCHQESISVSHWWVMNSTSLKKLSELFLIHRCSNNSNINQLRVNSDLHKRKTMLNSIKWFTSARSGASPNKSINADCQTVAVFLIARCTAGYLKR